MISLRFALLLFSTLLAGCTSTSAADDEATRLASWMERLEPFGMHGQVLVARGDDILLHEGYGIADEVTQRPITTETIFNIGSLAKQFTAAAALKLSSRGELDLHAPIGELLDELPEDKREITVHQLLTHTSGLPYHDDPATFLERPLAFEPGTRFAYSNPGYMLLARIVSEVSGREFTEYVVTEIFERAGLQRTVFLGSEPWPGDDDAHAYTDATDQGSVADWPRDEAGLGPGGIASTALDLWRWEQALETDRVLPAHERALFRTQHVARSERSGYAYGWMTALTERDTRIVMHQGNHGGFNSDHRRYLDEDVTLIFLSNRFVNGRSMRDAVVNDLSRLLHGGSAAQPPPTVAPPADAFAELRGSYEIAPGARVVVTPSAGGLEVVASDQQSLNAVFCPDANADELMFIARSNQRGEESLRRSMHGDLGGLDALLSPALPRDRALSSLESTFGELRETLGEPIGTNAIGTALAGGERSGKSWIRVEYERATRIVQLTWDLEEIVHLTLVDGVEPRLFLACGENEFAAYDLFTNRTVRIGFEREGELAIAGAAGVLVGRRNS